MPYNPCGYACDVLRSCYSTTARFLLSDPTHESPIHWYFVPDTRAWLPFPSVINSLNWRDKPPKVIDVGDLGEIPGRVRAYSKGVTPLGANGTVIAGTSSDFDLGGTAADPPIPIIPSGLPATCGNWQYFLTQPANLHIFPFFNMARVP